MDCSLPSEETIFYIQQRRRQEHDPESTLQRERVLQQQELQKRAHELRSGLLERQSESKQTMLPLIADLDAIEITKPAEKLAQLTPVLEKMRAQVKKLRDELVPDQLELKEIKEKTQQLRTLLQELRTKQQNVQSRSQEDCRKISEIGANSIKSQAGIKTVNIKKGSEL